MFIGVEGAVRSVRTSCSRYARTIYKVFFFLVFVCVRNEIRQHWDISRIMRENCHTLKMFDNFFIWRVLCAYHEEFVVKPIFSLAINNNVSRLLLVCEQTGLIPNSDPLWNQRKKGTRNGGRGFPRFIFIFSHKNNFTRVWVNICYIKRPI